MRTSFFNERAEELARNRQINTLHKNEIDTITPSKAVLKRLDKELGLKDANAEKTTIARENAISDIRNLASFAAANHLMIPITNFNLIINATQCKTSGESTQNVEVKVNKSRNTNHDPLKVLPGENESLTSLFIKYYMVFSAGGSLAPPIFIVADDNIQYGT